jgi:hypothetical protein
MELPLALAATTGDDLPFAGLDLTQATRVGRR